MLFDIGREKTLENHKNLFQTYKHLKKILPYGIIKTSVPKEQRYTLRRKPIIRQIEREKKNNSNSLSIITKDLIYTKNIFLYSSEKGKSKKIINKIKTKD